MCFGAYAFDFFSTHSGLYPGQAITGKSALFTLGYTFGTELLAFFGHQALRLGKIAKGEELEERIVVEPKNKYGASLLRHRVARAEQQAKDQIQQEREQYRQHRKGKGAA